MKHPDHLTTELVVARVFDRNGQVMGATLGPAITFGYIAGRQLGSH